MMIPTCSFLSKTREDGSSVVMKHTDQEEMVGYLERASSSKLRRLRPRGGGVRLQGWDDDDDNSS